MRCRCIDLRRFVCLNTTSTSSSSGDVIYCTKGPSLNGHHLRTERIFKMSTRAWNGSIRWLEAGNTRSRILTCRCVVANCSDGSRIVKPMTTSKCKIGATLGCGPCSRSRRPRNRLEAVTAVPGAGEALIQSEWGIWAALTCAGAAALHMERSKLFSKFNAPLLATILGLLLSNLGIVPSHAPQTHRVINGYLLPLAVPLLLFSANLSKVLQTGRLLMSFSCASLATVIGSFLACATIPLHTMGPDSHNIAAALTARHIGGSINYVAVTELLGVTAGARMAGLAADDVIVTLYFVVLYSLAKREKNDSVTQGSITLESYADDSMTQTDRTGSLSISVLDGATAVGLGTILCAIGNSIASYIGYSGGNIAIVTMLTVLMATFVPKTFISPSLISSGEGLGSILLQLFFASVGASGSLYVVFQTAPKLFLWSLVGVSTHLVLVLLFERIFKFRRRETSISSNANIGGPATAASMAAAFGWKELVVPGIMIGILGYTIGTPIGVAAAPIFKTLIEWRASV